MQIKGMNGESYNVASAATGNAGLGFGIAGTALGLMQNGGLGNLFGGNAGCSENNPVNRYELNMAREADSLKAENSLLKSQVYTDQKIVDATAYLQGEIKDLAKEVRANKDAQYAINLEQASLNATVTATVSCMKGQIAQLQSLSELVVPQRKVCDTCCNSCS